MSEWDETSIIDEWMLTSFRPRVLRAACRCGKMIVEPSEGSEWHVARIYQARELRKMVGSVEF